MIAIALIITGIFMVVMGWRGTHGAVLNALGVTRHGG